MNQYRMRMKVMRMTMTRMTMMTMMMMIFKDEHVPQG